MINIIGTALKEFRAIAQKFYSGDKSNPDAYVAEVKAWLEVFNGQMKDAEAKKQENQEKGEEGKNKEKEEEKSEAEKAEEAKTE